MKKLFTLFVILFPYFNYAQPCEEIFMSEITDGDFKDKIIELYNPSDIAKDLTGYYIRISKNGSPTPDIILLSGTIAAKETYVVTHPQANSTILSKADLTDVKMNFTGNDAIVLRKGISTDIDKIGEIGIVPGANGWALLPTGNTKDSDIRRKYPIDKGETDWNNGKQQWTVHPKDSIQDIKVHNNVCNQPTVPTCVELFISEYLDGNFKDKAIEVYNPTESTVNLSDYALQIFQNGAPTPLDIPLSGNINPKETYVVTHPQANSTLLSKADQTSVNLNFDGNDAIVLKKGISSYVDKIGEIAVNPGSNGWTIPPSATTKDVDLRRKFPVDNGEGDWNTGKNQWDVHPKDSILDIKQHQNICATSAIYAEISFSIENPLISIDTVTSKKYLEYDIFTFGNNDSTFFRIAKLRMQYNKIAFGANMGGSGLPNLSVTLGSNFDTAYYQAPKYNVSDSVFEIQAGRKVNLPSFINTQITTIPQKFLHVKIEIQNCNINSNIYFTEMNVTAPSTSYCLTSTSLAGYNYNQVFYLHTLDINLPCSSGTSFLWLSEFNPKIIAAGLDTNSILTITGTGFGSTRGNGQVMFKNADNGGQTYLTAVDYIDYKFWGDSLIRVVVPSKVDTLLFAGNEAPAGSGYIKIVNNAADTVTSFDSLFVNYARANSLLPKDSLDTMVVQGKFIHYLAATQSADSSTLVFHLDTSIANYPIRVAIVKKAIKDWRCATSVNFMVDEVGIINQDYKSDGVSVIHIDPNLHGSPFVAQTQTISIGCGGQLFVKEADIKLSKDFTALTQFSPIPQWTYDTISSTVPNDSMDFYGTILHELGHAHALFHAINPNDIMFWARNPGPVPTIGRVSIDPTAQYGSLDGRTGAIEVVTESENLPPIGCSGLTVFISSNNSSCTNIDTKVKSSLKERYNFSLYPVPATDILNISYLLSSASHCQIKIIDLFGKEILPVNNAVQSEGKYQYQVNLSNLSSGFYFIIISINGTNQSHKIIKL